MGLHVSLLVPEQNVDLHCPRQLSEKFSSKVAQIEKWNNNDDSLQAVGVSFYYGMPVVLIGIVGG